MKSLFKIKIPNWPQQHLDLRLLIFLFAMACHLPAFTQATGSKKINENIVLTSSEDSLMNGAIEKARANWETFRKAFESKDSNLKGFAVKYPFKTIDGSEHMWLADVKYTKGKFYGYVNNQPEYTTEIEFGDKVIIDPTQISDWMYFEKNKLVGGYTILVALESLPEEKKNAMKKSLGISH